MDLTSSESYPCTTPQEKSAEAGATGSGEDVSLKAHVPPIQFGSTKNMAKIWPLPRTSAVGTCV